MVGLTIAAVFALLHNLQVPWVKARVRALALSAAHVDVDYGALNLRMASGVTIDDLVVRTPDELRTWAPELARIGRLDVAWSSSLFTGRSRRVERVVVSDAKVAVVVDDEHGKTSFDAWTSPGPSSSPRPDAPTPATRTSELAGKLLEVAALLPSVEVERLSVELVQLRSPAQGDAEREASRGAERTSLRGLALHVTPKITDGTWHVDANVGSPDNPMLLDAVRRVDDATVGDVEAKAWLSLDLTARDARIALDVEVLEQTFVANASPKRLLHAEATASFDSAAHTTRLVVGPCTVGDGVATLRATGELPDEGTPSVKHGEADVDFDALLALVPAELLPIRMTVRRGRAHLRVDDLGFDAAGHIRPNARGAFDVDVSELRLASPARNHDTVAHPAENIDIHESKIAASIEPGEDGILRAHANVTIGRGHVADAVVDGLSVAAEGTQAPSGTTDGTVTLAFDSLATAPVSRPVSRQLSREAARGDMRVTAKNGTLKLRVDDLLVDPNAPLATRGSATLDAKIRALNLQTGTNRSSFEQIAVHTAGTSSGHAPWSVKLDVRATLLDLTEGARKLLGKMPVHVGADLSDVFPDSAVPLASRAKAHVTVDAGDLHATIDAQNAQDAKKALDYQLDTKVATLAALQYLLPSDVAATLPVARMGFSVRSHGRIERIASTQPSLEQHTELRVDRPAFGGTSAHTLAMDLDASGTTLRHQLAGHLRFEGLAIPGMAPSDDVASFTTSFDRAQRKIDVDVETQGRAKTKTHASASFDEARRAVMFDVDGTTTAMTALAPLLKKIHGLEGLDVSRLDVGVSAHGALVGVVTDVAPDGSVALAGSPLRTAGLEGTIGIHAKHVAWTGGDASFSTPAIDVETTWHSEGEKRTLESRVDADEIHVANGFHAFDVTTLHHRMTATIEGDLLDPDVGAKHTMSIGSLGQDVAPTYSVGNATVALDFRRGRDGVVHVSRLDVVNSAGGTTFTLKGAADASAERRRLSLRGELHQDLGLLSNAPERFAARGKANVALRLESPDLAVFRTIADVRVEDADVRLPKSGIVVEGADGEVPITVSVRVGPHGVQVIREDQDNPYSSLRFADQHPLLSRRSFISIRKLTTPQVSISPIVGNFQIEENILSLRQFEMGVRGGRVTGQCALRWSGRNSTFDMHVRADGVQSTHGEPFTGSAALAISAAEHNIEGRADVLQIGKRHLLDLLDLQDPFHSDASVNRIRSALWFGYPDKLRLTFDHGFASMHVTFGGLAGLVSVGDVRGIPIGPLIDPLIAPLFPSKDEP